MDSFFKNIKHVATVVFLGFTLLANSFDISNASNTQNDQKIFDWYSKAAEKGDPWLISNWD